MKPLIIYIAETDHGDRSYPSITGQIIEECDAKGLNIKVFSEFGNREKGLGSEDERCKAGYISSDQIDGLVNERCVPMGNLFERFTKLIPQAKESLPENVTPSQVFQQRKEFIDNPETLRLLEAEVALREENQSQVGNGNSAGKNGKDFESFWGNGNAFVQQVAHRAMAQDVMSKRDGTEDVIIMVAGAPHIYGLDKELGNTFNGCPKLVLGNFQERPLVDLTNLESIRQAQVFSGKESCQMVGKVVGFAVDPTTKIATVPDSVVAEISSQIDRESFVERLGLEKSNSQKTTWAERMRSDSVKGDDGRS